ncbi:MAG: phospholipase [Arcobacter sp.]|nr:MAG: phospholipase [Arcobacter sp.]
MKLVFVHGWSVNSTTTYGELPEVLKRESPVELNIEIENIYIGEYISFHDEVLLDDISRAFEQARKDKLGNEDFACITHSTGGPVIRLWVELFYAKERLNECPLTHLIMLAPANHGSPLALLGKERVGRIKAWANGVEPGEGVLNWLELGSQGQWDLNSSWMNNSAIGNAFHSFVLSGETIDRKLYDFINDYLVEKGSDGVVRLCGANLNYKSVKLVQDCTLDGNPLKLVGDIYNSRKCAFEVINSASHTGDKIGIMESVKKSRKVKPVIYSIIKALEVNNQDDYNETSEIMRHQTLHTQSKHDRYMMFVFSLKDNYNNSIHDYDMLLLAGDDYEPDILPKGFFVDKQKNDSSGNLVYYLNYDKFKKLKNEKLGIRIVARPDKGFSYYEIAEFHLNNFELKELIKANETVMVEVVLERRIAENTFVLDSGSNSEKKFKTREPSINKLA